MKPALSPNSHDANFYVLHMLLTIKMQDSDNSFGQKQTFAVIIYRMSLI